MDSTAECPECHREWPKSSEQYACILIQGACIICRKDELDLEAIKKKAEELGAYEE